ncbi:MAG: hypothetical protein Q7J65_00495 [Candidatus Marinimicrobia bacterium]|nr:hypothetical protein [Candidatus Neomarinimicrobiota bacterium]
MNKQIEIGRTMIQSYNKLGYDAYNVSSHDFPGGFKRVRELENSADFPFISANILDSVSQQPLFKPYIIKKVSRKKFGIIGVTSLLKAPIKGAIIGVITESINKYLPEIRKQADYIILLAYLERDDEMEFFTQQLDIDFILVSGTFRYSRNLENKKGMLVARCGNIGKYAGILKFDLKEPDQQLTDISNLMVQMNYAEKRMNSFKDAAQDRPLEEFYAKDPNILRTIKSLETQIQILQDEIQTSKNPITYDLIDLDESIPDSPEIRSMLNDLEKRITQIQSN